MESIRPGFQLVAQLKRLQEWILQDILVLTLILMEHLKHPCGVSRKSQCNGFVSGCDNPPQMAYTRYNSPKKSSIKVGFSFPIKPSRNIYKWVVAHPPRKNRQNIQFDPAKKNLQHIEVGCSMVITSLYSL